MQSNFANYVPRNIRIAKRTLDLIGGLVGCSILFLILPWVALAIKLESQGPIFFRQVRLGATLPSGPTRFELLKFRSMVNDAEKLTGPVLATENDPRITRVGRFLRKTRLDEIPQFWHVLTGDMSLVGPRPERPELADDLEKNHPFFIERTYAVKPGITGPSQVEMTYDECATDIPSKIAYDFSYSLILTSFRNWLVTDLSILFKTIYVAVAGRGS